MAKWLDYSEDERNALIAKVAKAKNIDDAAAEKDWWVTAVLYAVFHTSIAEFSLFKGGTSFTTKTLLCCLCSILLATLRPSLMLSLW